jgi:hypothetical protein
MEENMLDAYCDLAARLDMAADLTAEYESRDIFEIPAVTYTFTYSRARPLTHITM